MIKKLFKNVQYKNKLKTVDFDIKIGLMMAMDDGSISKIIHKIKKETDGIPHVNIRFHIP